MRKKRGLKTEPWGTPESMFFQEEHCLLSTTLCFRL